MTERPEKSTRFPSKFLRKSPGLPLIASAKLLDGRPDRPSIGGRALLLSNRASQAC